MICVSVAGPALIQLGLEPLQAHLFVFWFALLSTITPPVCGAVFIAAGMINENWLKVALTAMALGIGLYIIPLAMIANPALIRLEGNPLGALLAAVQIGLGTVPDLLRDHRLPEPRVSIARGRCRFGDHFRIPVLILTALPPEIGVPGDLCLRR